MTLWIIPESDREGGSLSDLAPSPSQVAYTRHYETPTDKNESFMALESPWGPSGHHLPPFKKKK